MTTRQDDNASARYLTFGCYHHYHLFHQAELCALFLLHLERWRSKAGVAVWSYVIMPNHVHLLIHQHGNNSLGPELATMKSQFAYRALHWLSEEDQITHQKLLVNSRGTSKHRFWQHGGGYDRNLFDDEAIKKTMEYIHNNPVRAGLVEQPEDFKWSSARFWLLGEVAGFTPDLPMGW